METRVPPRHAEAGSSIELVGRAHELNELDRLLGHAVACRGSLCLITGEPGVGKTALATAFVARAGDRATVLWGACWAAGVAPAYWPWRQVLRTLPDAEEMLAELEEGAGEAEASRSRFALFDGIATLLAEAGRRTPITIVLDDLHAADAPSLVLLQFLGRALVTAPVLIVGTARDRETALPEDQAGQLARVGAEVRHLPLQGLGREQVAELVAGRAPGASQSFVAALHERTGGNPFFIDGLLALAGPRAADLVSVDALPLPTAVRDAVRGRLASLEPSARDLLDAASVIGLDFALGTLSRVADVEPAQAIGALEQPRVDGLIVDTGRGGDPRFSFSHALVQETLYEDLAVLRRMELHRAVAEALEQRLGQPVEPPLAELAHHFARALPLAPAEQARDYAQLAGDRAMAVSAWEDAARHYASALEVHEQLDADEERSFDLLLSLGRARSRAGDPGAARPTLIRAADVARRLAAARRFALAVIELGAVGLPAEFEDTQVVSLLEEALELLDDRPTELRGRVLARLAVQLYWSRSREEREGIVEEARRIAAGLDDPTARLEVLAQVDLSTSGPETPEHLEALDELLELAARAEDREAELQVRIWRVAALTQLGDLRAASGEMEGFARLSARVQQPRWDWYVPLLRAVMALAEGRLDEGERLRDQAASMAGLVQGSTAPHLLGAHLVSTRWVQGRLAELLEPATVLVDTHPELTPWRCVLAAALADAGRLQEARVELERLVAEEDVGIARDTAFLSSCVLLAHAAARVGDTGRARAIYDALAPYAGHNATLVSGGFLGPVARHLGVLAATFGDEATALEHFAAAREAAQRGHMSAMLEWIDADEAALGADVPAGGSEEREVAAAPPQAVLRREGDVWMASVGEHTVRLRHAKGLSYLAQLLARPGVELHALELVRADAGDAPPGDGDLGPVLDAAAKAAYRERLEELQAEIDEAESFSDLERATRAREELDALTDELARAAGLGGRDRRPGSSAERARVNATRAIRTVMKRIAEHDPVLGEELLTTVHTGTFCVYRPDTRRPLQWRVEER
jgi:tetratricopeptide (TPR) repeat protein